MIYSIGIDPDSHCTAVAVSCPDYIVATTAITVPKSTKGQRAVEEMIQALCFSLPGWLLTLSRGGFLKNEPQAVVGEGQQIYAGGKTKNWDSISMLGPIVGAAVACLRINSMAKVFVPKPSAWKGDIPKAVCQARILTRRNMEYEMRGSYNKVTRRDSRYCIPTNAQQHIQGQVEGVESTEYWKHVVDAIGLADWGLQQIGAWTPPPFTPPDSLRA